MKRTYHGSCHCGAAHFEANLGLTGTPMPKCNCSFYLKSGYKKALIGYDDLRMRLRI